MVRREPRDVEQLEQRLARDGLGPNALCVRRAAASSASFTRGVRRLHVGAGALEQLRERTALVGLLERRPAARRRRARRPRPRPRRASATIWWPWPSTSSITIRQVDVEPAGRRAGAARARPRATSSRSRRAPRRAAPRGSSCPPACPMRVGSENPSSRERARVAALIVPAPRATFPSQSTSRVRSICGIQYSRAARAVGVIRLGRRAGGPEDAEHAASRRARRSRGSARGRAGRCTHVPGVERRGLAVDVQRAVALEHVDDLVVLVEVVGRAADRDVADELGHRRAAELGRREQAELAARGRGRRSRRSSTATTAWRRAVGRQRVAHEHREQLEPVGVVDPPGGAAGDECRRPGREVDRARRRSWPLPLPART